MTMRDLERDENQKCTDPEVDAHWLTTRLWQGSFPYAGGGYLAELGFTVVVLCAYEMQAPEHFESIQCILCPMDDGRLSSAEAKQAHATAGSVAALWREGHRILITCAAGRNRSGLVSALTLRLIRGISGSAAVNRVKVVRPNALTNPSFVSYLNSLGPVTHIGPRHRPRSLIIAGR